MSARESYYGVHMGGIGIWVWGAIMALLDFAFGARWYFLVIYTIGAALSLYLVHLHAERLLAKAESEQA